MRPGYDELQTPEFKIVNKDFEILVIASGILSLLGGYSTYVFTRRIFSGSLFRRFKNLTRLQNLGISGLMSFIIMQTLAVQVERQTRAGIVFVTNQPIYSEWMHKTKIPSEPVEGNDESSGNFTYQPLIK